VGEYSMSEKHKLLDKKGSILFAASMATIILGLLCYQLQQIEATLFVLVAGVVLGAAFLARYFIINAPTGDTDLTPTGEGGQ
jgi:hypothetical protein